MSNLRDNKQPYSCVLLIEASSTKTVTYLFELIYEEYPKLVKHYNTKGLILDRVVLAQNFYSYYYLVHLQNTELNKQIIQSRCKVVQPILYATGGMRNFEEKYGNSMSEEFYKSYKEYLSINEILNKKILNEAIARTISGIEEGYFAWKSYSDISGGNCHAVIDLGGQTAQISDKSNIISKYLGKERALEAMNFPTDCRISSYNGEECRNQIKNYFIEHEFNPMNINFNKYCNTYVVSNFEYVLNDICKILPVYKKLDSSQLKDKQVLSYMDKTCEAKNKGISFSINVGGYKVMTDLICNSLNQNLINEHFGLLHKICFDGNYDYEVLKLSGAHDELQVYPSNLGWELGAIISYLEVQRESLMFVEKY